MSAAELAALDLAEPAPAAAPGESPPPPALTEAQEWAACPEMFGFVLAMWIPELDKVYTTQACEQWGDAMAKLAAVKGWKVAAFLAWIGPYVPVLMVSRALLVPTAQAVRDKIAALRAAQLAPAPESLPGANGSDTLAG